MGDDAGFDPCECIWNHELAMRRLISILRSSQSHCTDSECLPDLPGLQGRTGEESSTFFFAICWVVLALTLFFLRPPSMRSQPSGKSNDNQGPGPHPPNPPPAIN